MSRSTSDVRFSVSYSLFFCGVLENGLLVSYTTKSISGGSFEMYYETENDSLLSSTILDFMKPTSSAVASKISLKDAA